MSDFHAELEALFRHWYEKAENSREQYNKYGGEGDLNRYHAYRECADQLSKTCEEHEAYDTTISDGEVEHDSRRKTVVGPMGAGLTLVFACDHCCEVLDVEKDGDFFHFGEYHECFGELVRDVAMRTAGGGVKPTRQGIRINFPEADPHGGADGD